MSNIAQYEILKSETSEALCIKVREAIKDGWQPLGAPFREHHVWFQAITKNKATRI